MRVDELSLDSAEEETEKSCAKIIKQNNKE